jgi:AcrR family transcriptional regulator
MAKILDATVELLRTTPPDRVGVRDIAELSGHNQRFVVQWFGSKVELFRQAFLRLIDEFRATGQVLTRRSEPQPELVVLVRLMNWLVAHDAVLYPDTDERPLLDLMTSVYRRQFDLDEQVSRLLAQRLVAGLVSTILFGDLPRMTPEDLEQQIALDQRVGRLLAEHGVADQPLGKRRWLPWSSPCLPPRRRWQRAMLRPGRTSRSTVPRPLSSGTTPVAATWCSRPPRPTTRARTP